MPPKRSKADREKLKKEAAERKAQEEEEQRLREEEEAREREKRERQEREEETRRQALIDAHLREERGSLNEEEGKRRQQLEEWKRERSMRREWEHYISCNTLPLVTEEKPLNSWLSRHGDNKVSSVEETLKDIKDYLFLVREIEAAVIGDGQPLPTEEKKAYYMETLLQMKHTTLSKLSSLAHHCLVNAEKYLHPETFNLSMETSIPGELALCIWGNVVKNPRLKNFSFDYRSFTLELPKPLVLADVAIRVLYPPFDYLSPLSRSYACKSPPFTYTEREAPTNHGNNKVAVEYSGGDEKVEGNQLSTDQERGSALCTRLFM